LVRMLPPAPDASKILVIFASAYYWEPPSPFLARLRLSCSLPALWSWRERSRDARKRCGGADWHCHNNHRTHSPLDGRIPAYTRVATNHQFPLVSKASTLRALYQTPMAAQVFKDSALKF